MPSLPLAAAAAMAAFQLAPATEIMTGAPPERDPVDQSTSITIYSTATPGSIPPEMYRPVPGGDQGGFSPFANQPVPGYAVVRQTRKIQLQQGRSTVRFTDVAALIDPTTVSFTSLTDPGGTSVLEQNYQFDLVSPAKLLDKYIDRRITVQQTHGDKVDLTAGTLLSTGAGGGLVLQDENTREIHLISSYSNILFPDLPGGLLTRPTLVWDITADKGGEHDARVSYQTTAVTWWADYNITMTDGADSGSAALDIGAWVSIINRSGATYPDAKLKLIAGDVHRSTPPQNVPRSMAARGAEDSGVAGFAEKAFFEYHLYTLGRPTTIPQNSTKQVELFPAVTAVPAERVLVYYGMPQGQYWFNQTPAVDRNLGTQMNTKVDAYLRFKNDKEHGMGMPLPSGRIRVSKLDPADGSLEFIGEDVIDHTARDEEVLVRMGSAFDVIGERKQVDFKADTNAHWMEETVEIKLRNHKNESVKVIIKENMYRWSTWTITSETAKHEKVDSRTVYFPVRVEKDQESTVRYTVRYTW